MCPPDFVRIAGMGGQGLVASVQVPVVDGVHARKVGRQLDVLGRIHLSELRGRRARGRAAR